jgi:hypothetical protein
LKAAFENAQTKADRQLLAVTLIHLGEKSARYFDFLADYARRAIEDRTPSSLKYDATEQPVKGEYSGAFEEWCVQHEKEPKAVERLQSQYAMDVLMLARARDDRAADLFLRGLDSPNEFVIIYSVQGLGRLQLTAALPRIADTARRLPAGAAAGIGMQLPWYSSVEAYQLMERLVHDPRLRESFRSAIGMERRAELEREQRRNGFSAPR